MAVQTSVSSAPAVGLVGQMASTEGAEFTSRLSEEAISPGAPVCPGDTLGEVTCRLVDGANDIDGTEHQLIGIAVLDPYRTAKEYADGDTVLIMTKGEMFVTVSTAASLINGDVYVLEAGTGFRGTADATATLVTNAVFVTAGTGIQKIRITGQMGA